jgi:NADPH:quinone reductase-like Zn-dependent oxidoreductase
MRAVAFHDHGGPEVLQSVELPEPELRERDILVEVRAASVNPVDTKVRSRKGSMLHLRARRDCCART